jgi:hypothetical protein
MGITNIFMNSYQHPENKLTYNFLCLVEYCGFQRELCEYLTDNRIALSHNPVEGIEPIFSGGESNPDGMLSLKGTDEERYSVYIENKTHRLALGHKQLSRHLKKYCTSPNTILLVITPRIRDVEVINRLGTSKSKVVFRTWSQVANKIAELNRGLDQPSFVATQFLDYGIRSGEFEDMADLSRDELNHFVQTINSNFRGRAFAILDSVTNDLDYGQFGFQDVERKQVDHYGRFGINFTFARKNDHSQWMFYGIYYNTSDHGIPFKIQRIPELAFFFDISNSERERLLQNPSLIESLRVLSAYGFENNRAVP